MDTVYDWITVGLFAALIVLFLQRSTSPGPDEKQDSLLTYLAAGAGCAVGNYLGNEGLHVLAVITIIGTVALVFYKLKPFAYPRGD